MNVIIFGPPGVGKGTQSKRIQEAYGLCHVSTGDILRREIAKKSRTGLQAEQHVTRGEMVPDELIIRLVKRRLASDTQCQRNGWLLDGFPRTAAQAEEMDRLFLLPDKCVILDVPKDVLVERVTGRRTDPETGKIYHLKFNPPKVDPDDESEEAAAKATAETEAIVARLTQREDDTEEALAKRLEAFDSNRAAIEDAFSAMAKVVDGNRAKDDVW